MEYSAAQLLPEWRQQDSLLANATAGFGKPHVSNMFQQTHSALPLSASLKIVQAPAAYNRPIVQKKFFKPSFIVRSHCSSSFFSAAPPLLLCFHAASMLLPCCFHAASLLPLCCFHAAVMLLPSCCLACCFLPSCCFQAAFDLPLCCFHAASMLLPCCFHAASLHAAFTCHNCSTPF